MKYIILHLACLLQRPKHWRFHLAGMLRELTHSH